MIKLGRIWKIGDGKLMKRKIIHVDMDAFYAAVEQRDNPELQGKPVVIGGRAKSRGVVSTASYEARKFGIRSAMPLIEAYHRCPQAIFLPPNLVKYRWVSQQIMEIFSEFTPLVEAISLDEAFLDVTGTERLFGEAVVIAKRIKKRIKDELNLTCSIGIAPNKFLAKLASDLEKPDGLVVITEDDIQSKVWPLPVGKVWGVGYKTAQRLEEFNIKTIGDLAGTHVDLLARILGNWGLEAHKLANGIDNRPVLPEREAHSIGHEMTFDVDISDKEILTRILLELSQNVGFRLRRAGLKGRTIVLKLRFADFKTITRNHTRLEETNFDDVIFEESLNLFQSNYSGQESLRLIGVTVTGLVKENEVSKQFTLFSDNDDKFEELYKTLDQINIKYGKNTIIRASLLNDEK